MLRGLHYESDKSKGMCEAKKTKRFRSAFTTSQINYLEIQFEKCPYIGSATRKEVANLLNIQERAIKIWFQNRRMKEKKEQINKEQDLDRHTKTNIDRYNSTSNVKFAKDSLNNVHFSQSTNDRQCSLQSTIEKHVDKTNCTSYYRNAFCNQSRNQKEIIDTRKSNKCKESGMANYVKKDVKSMFFSEPANSIKCNPNKNPNNKNLVNYLEMSKKNAAKHKAVPKTTLKPESTRNSMPNVHSTLPNYQDSPEDLSASNLSNPMMPQNHHRIHLSPAYIPYCNSQNVCLSAGNVIWKPVNVMPAVPPNNISLTVPERQTRGQNAQKCTCNCNCNARNKTDYNHSNIESQPQYVIAIPYNNNLNILR